MVAVTNNSGRDWDQWTPSGYVRIPNGATVDIDLSEGQQIELLDLGFEIASDKPRRGRPPNQPDVAMQSATNTETANEG